MASLLQSLDIEAVWVAAKERDRRVLVEELIETVVVFPGHLEVTVTPPPAECSLWRGRAEGLGF